MSVRVRIAPSPTGDPHVGTAYVALFNWLFAKKHKGTFILRIEDTDLQRCSEACEASIFETLRWLGINWSEGPDVGGPYGPYRQSERKDLYVKHAFQLLEEGKAYKCFATPEELCLMRAFCSGGRKGYDRRYRYLSEDELAQREATNEPYVIRLKVPLEGEARFEDGIRGEITYPWSDVDDQILLKSDGMPTYHLANVVDDHYMKISHVLRGDEWVSSTPKHLFLYECFEWDIPQFCHLPLLLDQSGKKLSKRKNPTSIFFFRDIGILPSCLVNFLSLMGYSHPEGKEIYTKDELVPDFDLKRIGRSGAFFDMRRLKWLNQCYLKDLCSEQDLLQSLHNWKWNEEFFSRIIPLAHSRIKTLSDFFALCDFFFIEDVPLTHDLLCPREMTAKKTAHFLTTLIWELEEQKNWKREGIALASKKLAEEWNLHHKKDVMPILFGAIMGRKYGLPMFDSFEILGPHQARVRLMQAIQFLGALSTQENTLLKVLQKEYRLGEWSDAFQSCSIDS